MLNSIFADYEFLFARHLILKMQVAHGETQIAHGETQAANVGTQLAFQELSARKWHSQHVRNKISDSKKRIGQAQNTQKYLTKFGFLLAYS